jgi:precorrin-3B C17-methyltransferase
LPSENKFFIVGIGPGGLPWRTIAAVEAIKAADFVVGYKPYLDLISDLLGGKKVFSNGMGKEVDRVRTAINLLEEGSVALVSSGDPNVYGMAGLGLELSPHPENVEIVPGVTSFTAAACRAGLAFRECVAVISLSDLLTPWQDIETRLRTAAETNMPVALYNPRSKRRDWQLIRALEICGQRDVLVARDVGREKEEIFWTTSSILRDEAALREKIDMTTLVIISGRGVFKEETGIESEMNIVGIGPGDSRHLTIEAKNILKSSKKIFGAERYLNLIGDLSSAEKIAHTGPCPERMAARFREAKDTAENCQKSSILTGGDPSIFSSGWMVLDMSRGVMPVHICPGISAFSSVASKAGAPLINDFALLSSPEDPSSLSSLAATGFGVVVYNVKGRALSSLLREIEPQRPCALARDVARSGEEMIVLSAKDLLDTNPDGFRFTLLIASANSYIKKGRIIARRGYETKYSY